MHIYKQFHGLVNGKQTALSAYELRAPFEVGITGSAENKGTGFTGRSLQHPLFPAKILYSTENEGSKTHLEMILERRFKRGTLP